jgi:hypothetical protein
MNIYTKSMHSKLMVIFVLGLLTLNTLASTPKIPSPSVSVSDYVEIQQLYATYCHALDRADLKLLASLWINDGEFVGGKGPGNKYADRTPRKGKSITGDNGATRHFTSNLVATLTPEGAKASVYLILYNARTVPPTFVETAIYDDTLVKTSQGWKFKKRVVWRDDDDITPFKPGPPKVRTSDKK